MGSSQTRARTHVPCIGRWILNHCATREALRWLFSDTENWVVFYFLKRLEFIYLLIYFWLCWVFVSVQGLSLVVASRGHSSSRCAGLSLSQPLLLRSTGSRCTGSVVVAHGPSCSVACGIFPDQGSNPGPLHWQADSQPLCHQGSPVLFSFYVWLLCLTPPQRLPDARGINSKLLSVAPAYLSDLCLPLAQRPRASGPPCLLLPHQVCSCL